MPCLLPCCLPQAAEQLEERHGKNKLSCYSAPAVVTARTGNAQ